MQHGEHRGALVDRRHQVSHDETERLATKPPTTAAAREAREAEPSPSPSATGSMPAMMASVVIEDGAGFPCPRRRRPSRSCPG